MLGGEENLDVAERFARFTKLMSKLVRFDGNTKETREPLQKQNAHHGNSYAFANASATAGCTTRPAFTLMPACNGAS